MTSHDVVKFILVDDVEENLLALEALLKREGLELLKARSGHEALELLLVHDVSLALLDVQMPGMDGFELAELMRGTERTRNIPIIFLTAVATDERRRFRGYETGAVDYLLKPLDPQILKSKANIFFELSRQRQELARQRDELRVTAQTLSTVLARLQAHSDNSPLAIVECDQDFRLVSWSDSAERLFGWGASEVIGRPMGELRWVHEDSAEAFAALAAEMRAGTQSRTKQISRAYRKDGSIIDCEWYGSALRDGLGRLTSVNWQILDVTERARAEETQRLLIGELNHRVKNTLASVQAIATQTLRHAESPEAFATAFIGRIQALARAHSLLSSAIWRGAKLAELIQNQVRLGLIDETRLAAIGPDVDFEPEMALHLALVLHELTTNAHKYGAFSTPHGRVDLTWTLETGSIRMSWVESGGPTVKPPTRHGFGTSLIERSLRAMGGQAKATYGADGAQWLFTVPLALQPDQPAGTQPSPAGTGDEGFALPGDAAGEPSGIAGKRFIVIEDEPLVALELTALLEDAGARVVGTAGTAEQAIRLIETAAPDGALLDANLHGQAVDEIASELTRRHVPFLFVSGYGREHLPRDFSHVAVVGKPFDPKGLIVAAQQLTPSLQPENSAISAEENAPKRVIRLRG
ncbi:response regulator [Pedomonas mirosovicensis]|uniref:response regulator n=1 Tax=Pedomonas mirosovicensis TaxID=2908641 RepID=UPI0021684F5E|nr:response regulator [Pedomonas mirosovicensis]MCH8686568.1 response regulator [Pedomonas mirosovicensis]